MRHALALARRGKNHVEPNPMVGAVVVRSGRIVGEGYHRFFGGPHAEVEALRKAGSRARGGTLYVTLEPCCHQGKTPPCTGLIVRSGIRLVVAAIQDRNPLVRGRGFTALRRAGIEVISNVMKKEAARLNAPFFKHIRNPHPTVVAKWAMTLDGKIATSTGDSKWISSGLSRQWAKQLRRESHAIVVGIQTVLNDNPRLLWRPSSLRNPIRVVLDRSARIPLDSVLVKTARRFRTCVFVEASAPERKIQALVRVGCRVLTLSKISFASVLRELSRMGCRRILIEGGGAVLGSAFDAGIVDEVCVFVAPKIVGGRGATVPVMGKGVRAMADAWHLRNVRIRSMGSDVIIRGNVIR